MTNPNSKTYVNTTSPPFTQEIFEDVGLALCVALLDHLGCNPVSRIPLSCFRSVENVKDDIKNNLAKYATGQINVCGANHFSSNNTKVGKHYGSGKYDNVLLRKEPVKRQSSSQSKEPQSALLKQSKQGTFGGAKRLTADNRHEKGKKAAALAAA